MRVQCLGNHTKTHQTVSCCDWPSLAVMVNTNDLERKDWKGLLSVNTHCQYPTVGSSQSASASGRGTFCSADRDRDRCVSVHRPPT